MRRAVAGFAILASLIAVGCDASQKKKDNNSSGPSEPPFAEKLQGVWKSDCIGGSSARTEEYRFEAGVRTTTLSYFSAPGCDAGSETMKIVIKGSYRINGANDKVEATQEVVYTVSESAITTLTDAATQAANTKSFCKKSDWAANTAKAVDGKDCGLPFQNGADIKEYFDFDGALLVSYAPTSLNDIELKKAN